MRPTKRTLSQNDRLSDEREDYSPNLHRIAISNLEDEYLRIKRWWHKKYRKPRRDFEEHTIEELVIEMLEDFYERNPAEIQKFLNGSEEEWDGSTSEEYERSIRKRAQKIWDRNKVDLSKWQTKTEVGDEEEKKILDDLGKNLLGSSRKINQAPVVEGEFDEDFT